MLSENALNQVKSLSFHSRCSLSHRYLCLTVPKVGCSTIKRTLQAYEGLGITPLNRLEEVHHGAQDQRFNAFQPEVLRLMLESPHIFRFAFVRNPYDRILSAWKSKIDSGDPAYETLRQELMCEFKVDDVFFDVFVEALASSTNTRLQQDHHWKPQAQILVPTLVKYDFIGRFERFNKDFEYILDVLDAPNLVRNLGVQKTNSTPIMPSSYTSWSAKQVRYLYRTDFEIFGYDPDYWQFI